MQFRRSLCNRDKPKSESPSPACNAVNFAKYAGEVAHWLLWRKGVGFFQDKPKGIVVMGKQIVQKIGHEPGLFRLLHLAHVENVDMPDETMSSPMIGPAASCNGVSA